MIRLGLNIDHVATLRQVRGGHVKYPNIVRAAQQCMEAGADLITVHLRGDRRHIQDFDLAALSKERFPINLEIAATEEMTQAAIKNSPKIVCLVPEKREELTTEGGLDVIKFEKKIKTCIDHLHRKNILVSLFIEAEEMQIKMSNRLGADAVEFHTGQYALATGKDVDSEFEKLKEGCIAAHGLGLQVHAGHGLDYDNVGRIAKLPHVEELNIGHAIICESIFVGLPEAVKRMKNLIK